MARKSTRALFDVARFVAVLLLLPALSAGEEVTVENDSVVNGSNIAIQAGFVPPESAAAWLTSPCAGNLVAVQVFWSSLIPGTASQTVEDSITIFEAGDFPEPGTQLDQLVGPQMTDGVFNEFRFKDANNTVPLSVSLANGQDFVIAFTFFNFPNELLGPSVVTDVDGCRAQRNAIHATSPLGLIWLDSCLLGLSGDFSIRGVVDCPDPGIFTDGFESGDTTLWSVAAPSP